MDRRKLDKMFRELHIDAIISEASQTRQWYSEIATSDGWIIIEPNHATLFVDGRYFEYARKNAKNVNSVELLKGNSLKDWLQAKQFKRIAIEEDYLNVQNRTRVKSMTGLEDSAIIPIKGKDLRIVKSKDEIEKIQKAIDISLEAYEKLQPFITEGISEKELQHKLEYIMARLGAEKEAFDSIIGFAESTAEPHHHTTNKKLKKGDMVTIDFGAKYNGYVADITRTFVFDANNSTNPNIQKYKEVLSIVEEAARLGRQAVRPGIKASTIDEICRSYIASKGYSKFFVHSTGHGIGLDVHEFPNVYALGDTILEEGMIITVEPGIYLEGICGARIEDDVLVTSTGGKVLSRKE